MWSQTEGRVTHFIASLGTCGTLRGAGRYLREKGQVTVVGVCPNKKHDIPGVRSIEQATVTEHYAPDIYDHLEEVSNEEAFGMCAQMNQREAIPCGPSSGMQVVGALRHLPDTPGTVGVVIFCDSVFKYATSVTKYCPSIFPAEDTHLEPAEVTALSRVYGHASSDASITVPPGGLRAALARKPLVVDVRPENEFASRLRVAGAISVPLATLLGEGEVQRLSEEAGVVKRAAKRARVGEGLPPHNGPVLFVCNRGKDSLLAVLALRVSRGGDVQHIGGGMFSVAEAELETEGPPVLPPAVDEEEEQRLQALGYAQDGTKR